MAKNVGAGCAPWLVLGVIVVAIGRCVGGGDSSPTYSNDPYAIALTPERLTATSHRYTQAASLNCRAEPSTSARRVEALSQGSYVGVVRTGDGWSLLDRSSPCWVSSRYLGSSPPPARPARFYGGGGDRGGAERRSSGSARGSGWSYRNCSAARAAGAAPVYAGEPGYGRHLDRDGDGIGCER